MKNTCQAPKSLLILVFVASILPTLASCKETDSSNGEVSFQIHRDARLGKPILSFRKPPKDQYGRRAIDTLELFFEHIRDEKNEEAKNLCCFSVIAAKAHHQIGHVDCKNLPQDPHYAELAIEKIESSKALFSEYAEILSQADSFTLGATVKQKSVYWMVKVKAEGLSSSMEPGHFYLIYQDNEWHVLISDLVYKMENYESRKQ